MPTAFRDFHSRRLAVSDRLRQAGDLIETAGLPTAAQGLRNRSETLRNEQFRIAVIGEFSAGKSTLLNAFLGEKALPAKMAPCTVANVEIGYGEERRLLVRYRGQTEWSEEPMERLKEFAVIKSFDDEDAKREVEESPVERLRIEAPIDVCRNGVTFVDTPGLNEHQARSSVTQGILGRVDAAVFLTSATQLWSGSERQFIADEATKAPDLRRWLNYVFVAATFADAALEDEDGEDELRARMDSFCSSLLEPHGLAPERRYFIDANSVVRRREGRKGRSDGFDFGRLEGDIAAFIVEERGEVMLRHAREGALAEIRRTVDVLDAELREDAAAAEEKRRVAESASVRLEQERGRVRELSAALRGYGPDLAKRLSEELELAQHRWLQVGLPEYLETQEYPKTIVRPKPPTEWFATQASGWLDRQFQAWSNQVPVREFEAVLERFQREYKDDLSEFRRAVQEISRGLGGVDFGPEDEDEDGLGWILRTGAGWLAGGPLGAIVGGAMGWQAVATNLAINFGVGLVLGALGLAVPVIGWIVIAAVVGAVQLFVGQDGIQKRIRSGVLKGYRENLPAHLEKVDAKLREGAVASVGEVADALDAASAGLLSQLEEQAQRRLKQAVLTEQQAGERAGKLAAVRDQLAALADEVVAA